MNILSLFLKGNKKRKTTNFSDFFMHAKSKERKKTFLIIAKKASKSQKDISLKAKEICASR